MWTTANPWRYRKQTIFLLQQILKQYTNEKIGIPSIETVLLTYNSASIDGVVFTFYESRIVVDYSDLPEKFKDLFDSDEVRREGDRLQRHVNELSNTLQRIQAPNMRVSIIFNFFLISLLTIASFDVFQGYAKTWFGQEQVARNKWRIWKSPCKS